jgi:hypothetical protein
MLTTLAMEDEFSVNQPGRALDHLRHHQAELRQTILATREISA